MGVHRFNITLGELYLHIDALRNRVMRKNFPIPNNLLKQLGWLIYALATAVVVHVAQYIGFLVYQIALLLDMFLFGKRKKVADPSQYDASRDAFNSMVTDALERMDKSVAEADANPTEQSQNLTEAHLNEVDAVLSDADKKSLLEIASESRELASKAREGTLTVDEVTGGTFTISNVSMLEVDGFTPILRPPETGILGVGRVKEKPAVHDGQIAIRSMMFLCLTFDHRVVDGAPAIEFLQDLARHLENPLLIMA